MNIDLTFLDAKRLKNLQTFTLPDPLEYRMPLGEYNTSGRIEKLNLVKLNEIKMQSLQIKVQKRQNPYKPPIVQRDIYQKILYKPSHSFHDTLLHFQPQ